MAWSHQDIPDLSGKSFVVTGGNAGIGFETVAALAAKGAQVVIACRNPQKGDEALARILALHPRADIRVLPLDLASLASVRSFAARLGEQWHALDGLINNAGIMMLPYGRTEDDFELQFGTNFLGHFALTGLLLPLLERAARARVVTMTSLAHWPGRIDFDNLNAEQGYSRFGAYAQSKLADLVFAHELHRRLRATRRRTLSLATHPGVTRSDLARYSLFVRVLMPLTAQDTRAGAWPSLMAATATDVSSGEFLGPGRLLGTRGAPRRQACSRASLDEATGQRLWDLAQRWTGVHYPE